MKRNVENVKRLLGAIERNIDKDNLEVLAKLLNYHAPQLQEDIEAIKYINVTEKKGEA